MRLAALALAGAVLALAPAARAADEPVRTTHFYGWQNLVVDYSGAVLAARGLWIQNPLMFGAGTATWCFGGAVVHGVHGNTTAALLSPVIQIGMPALFFGIGYAGTTNRWDKDDNGALLAFVGALGAPVIDALLGREPLPGEKPRTMALAPSVERGRVGLNLVGAF